MALSAGISSATNGGASFPIVSKNYSAGFKLGWERRKSITKKLVFFHGPSFRAIYYHNLNEDMDPAKPAYQRKFVSDNVNAAIPYALGLLFQIHSNFYIAGELDPSVYGTYQKNSNRGNNFHFYNGGIGFDSRYGLLSFVYRY